MKAVVRQRRPAFDRERGVEIAEELFHARGYDAVSVADLTQALGIVPPSLYAAYGSKLELFERALRNYATHHSLPVDELLAQKGTPTEVLTNLFIAAARQYTDNPRRLGCMVTEAMRADDEKAAALASNFAEHGITLLRTYVSSHARARDVERIVDYLLLNLRGLSSYACLGYAQKKLVECSKIAGGALATEFANARKAP
jgi:TetR/AcrR family transcriptional repressor for divergent bdcA